MLGNAVKSAWPLFLGMLLLMISNGLLATLLTVRGYEYGFSETVIGLMQSAYPVGALAGCLVAPRILAKVGHVRAFGALASLCSTAALVHLVTDDPISWSLMRGLAGFCFPGLYVIAESWLNGIADNKSRGTILSIYFVIQSAGAGMGQFFLKIPDETGNLLFVIVSILISIALVPMLLSAQSGQQFEEPERISLRALFKISPLGFMGSFLNGMAQSALYVGSGIYALAIGMEPQDAGLLIVCMTLGAVLGQFPIGILSDKIGRTPLILLTLSGSSAVCVYLIFQGTQGATENMAVLFLIIVVLGSMVMTGYSLFVAHTNDYLKPSQIIPASGALVMVMNSGIIFGPTLGAYAIENFGPMGLFYLVFGIQVTTLLVTIWRRAIYRKEAVNPGSMAPVSMTTTPMTASLHPDGPDQDVSQTVYRKYS